MDLDGTNTFLRGAVVFILPHTEPLNASQGTGAFFDLQINKWTAVATWHYSVEDNICGVCRNVFEKMCHKCTQAENVCPILTGKCNHSFHRHCLDDWLRSSYSRGLCPLCRQQWAIHDDYWNRLVFN